MLFESWSKVTSTPVTLTIPQTGRRAIQDQTSSQQFPLTLINFNGLTTVSIIHISDSCTPSYLVENFCLMLNANIIQIIECRHCNYSWRESWELPMWRSYRRGT